MNNTDVEWLCRLIHSNRAFELTPLTMSCPPIG